MTLFRIEGVAPEDLHNWKYCKNCTKLIPFNLFSSHKKDCCNTSSSPKQVEDFKPQNPSTHADTDIGGEINQVESSSLQVEDPRVMTLRETIMISSGGDFNDVTIICEDGLMKSNSFLLAAIFPLLRNMFNYSLQSNEEDIFITLPDVELLELTEFFHNIHQGKQSITIGSGIINLFGMKVQQKKKNPFTHAQVAKNTVIVEKTNQFGKQNDPNVSTEDLRAVPKIPAPGINTITGEIIPPKFYCSFCCYKAENQASLDAHIRFVHQKERIPCPECPIVYNSHVKVKNIKQHLRVVHEISDGNPIKCGYCDDYVSLAGMADHIKNSHPEEWYGEGYEHKIEKEINDNKQGQNSEVNYECGGQCGNESCGAKMKSLYSLKRHAVTYLKKQPRPCPLRCGSMRNSDYAMIRPLQTHEEGWLGLRRCKTCNRTFSSDISIEDHKKECYPPEKNFMCNLCGEAFIKEYVLNDHINRRHEVHDEKKYLCEKCNKGFAFEDKLKHHLKIHEDKTPCPECGVTVRHLKLHIVTAHTPDNLKKYQCHDCGKGFNDTRTLEIHRMNVHLKLRPYKCRYEECDYDFAYNDLSNRNAHEKKKHGKLKD